MNEQTITQLKEFFTPVAEKVGEGAEFGWEVVMKQQYVVATLGLAWVLLGLIGLFITYKIVKKILASDVYDPKFPATIIGLAGGFLCLIAIIEGGYDAITHFINPEFYAIEFFIGLVK